MKNKALLFSMDGVKQIKYLESLILTLPQININDFDLLFLINFELRNNPDIKKIFNILKKRGANLKVNYIEEDIPGMFYWLLVPHFFNYDSIIQLDVDILIGPKTNFNNLIKENEKEDFAFLGIKVNLLDAPKAAGVILKFSNLKSKSDFINRKYINTGVVLMRTKEIMNIKLFSKKETLLNSIKEYVKWCKLNKLMITDQEYLFLHIEEASLGFIKSNWNIRIFDKKGIIENSNNENFILHFNMKILSFKKFKMEKINYSKYFMNSLEEKDWKIFSKSLIRFVKICRPSYWFPFKSRTKIGKRDKKLFSSIKKLSEKVMTSIF